MKKNKKHYLITGGLGFIGSHACIDLIGYGYNVLIIDSALRDLLEFMFFLVVGFTAGTLGIV